MRVRKTYPGGWQIVSFVSRLADAVEERYSIDELELLCVVWSIEHFKYYLYSKPFKVISDHRASFLLREEIEHISCIIFDSQDGLTA